MTNFLQYCKCITFQETVKIFSLQNIAKGKIGSTEIKESVVIIMGALVHKLCLKGSCNLSVSFQENLFKKS